MSKKLKKTFAERAKDIQKEFEGLTDPISRRTMMDKFEKLKAEQEAMKALQQEAQSKRQGLGLGPRDGMGPHNQNMFGGGGGLTNPPYDDVEPGYYDTSTGEYNPSTYDILSQREDIPMMVSRGIRDIEPEMKYDYRDTSGYNPSININEDPRKPMSITDKLKRGTIDLVNGWKDLDERDKSLPLRMAPAFRNMAALRQLERPDPNELIQLTNSVGRERADRVAPKRDIRGDVSRNKYLMADMANGDINQFMRGIAGLTNQRNRAMSQVDQQANQFDQAQRAREMEMRNRYDIANAQYKYNKLENDAKDKAAYEASLADLRNAIANDVAGLGTEYFNRGTSDRMVDANSEAWILAAMEGNERKKDAEWKAAMARRGGDYKANNYRNYKK